MSPVRPLLLFAPGFARRNFASPLTELARPECRWAMLACQTWAGNRLGGRERPPYDRRVKVKMSISLDPELGDARYGRPPPRQGGPVPGERDRVLTERGALGRGGPRALGWGGWDYRRKPLVWEMKHVDARVASVGR
jgi:hypothetical protein